MITNIGPYGVEEPKIDISLATITRTSLTYTGSDQTPIWTVNYNGETLVEGTDYERPTITKGNQAAASASGSLTSYSQQFKGIGRFEGTVSKEFTIERKKSTSSLGTVTWTGLPTSIAESSSSGSYSTVKCTITHSSRYGVSLNYTKTSSNGASVTSTGSTSLYSTYVSRRIKIYKSSPSYTSATWKGYFTARFNGTNYYYETKSSTVNLYYP